MPPKKGAQTAPNPAAAGRPRRSTVVDTTTTPANEITTSSPAPVAVAAKKRGRPSKAAEEAASGPPKKRGRPSKGAIGSDPVTTAEAEAEAEVAAEIEPIPKKRGRPKKEVPAAPLKNSDRPKKELPTVSLPAVSLQEKAPPKKRGRPPKGGQTTNIKADGPAAAEQLEEELEVAIEKNANDPPSKRKSPILNEILSESKGKIKVDEVADQTLERAENAAKQYWLMKAEQEDRMETLKSGRVFNTKFTIDDLRDKGGPEPWDGVRNVVARNNMRAMKKGDLAFFYASGGKQGRKPGITGIMQVVKEHEPDVSTHDEDAIGYVEKEDDRDKWSIVHVEYRKKLSVPVSLKELQKHGSGMLEDMQVLKTTRMSVTGVSEEEWNFIVDNLIEGYENDE